MPSLKVLRAQNALRPPIRLYESADAPALDRILSENRGHDVRLDRDRIVCLGVPGKPVGLLAWRPGGIVHELHAGNGLGRRRIAESLIQFAIRDAISKPFDLWEAVFVTDSDAMAGYALEIGAVEQTGKRVFTLGVR